jgi:O-antigen/teichoic acid export membrane protein
VLLVIVLFFKTDISNLSGNKEIENWLFLIPLSTLLVGIYNSLNFFNIRKKEFKNVSVSLVSRSIGLSLSQVIIGLITLGPIGLIVGQIISYLTGNTMLYKTLKEARKNTLISKKNVKKQAIIYKKFPLFSLPSIFINSINLNIINFLITTGFSLTTLGFYSLTQRILGIPARVIGSSFSQVYFQKASQEYNLNGTTEIIYIKTLKKLVLISIPIFLIMFLVAEPVFTLVFGQKWIVSGTYAKMLIPLAASRFVSSALSNTLAVHQKQQFGLIINLLLLTTTISVFTFSKFYNIDFLQTLTYYAMFLSIEYILFICLYWRISKLK